MNQKNKHILKFTVILQDTLFHEKAVTLIVLSKQIEIFCWCEYPVCIWRNILVTVVLVTKQDMSNLLENYPQVC